jgi:hypothetical protein
MTAATQIIDRIGSCLAQVANGLVGGLGDVDGFQFPSTQQWAKLAELKCWRAKFI